MAQFYDTEVAAWQVILGKTMHYNFGVRDPKSSNNDAEAHLIYGT